VPLEDSIQREYGRLIALLATIPPSQRTRKEIDGTGGKVSISDLIAYQIGWGKCLIRWYEAGIKNEAAELPGEGFSTWNYVGIATHFYQKYAFDQAEQQAREFENVVGRILRIVEEEHRSGNLEKIGIWPWCTLQSGKQWPLSKWIQINTSSPYKRAHSLIASYLKGIFH